MTISQSREPGIEGKDMDCSPAGGPAVLDRDFRAVGPFDNEDAQRERAGLPPEAVLLAVGFLLYEPFPITVPMRMPEGVWAMDVAVEDVCVTGDRAGLVELFAGCWTRDHGRPAQASLGDDLVLRLSPPGGVDGSVPDEQPGRMDVALWVAYRGQGVLVGSWPSQDGGWPRVVAPTVAAVMWLCSDLLDHGLTEGISGR
jgi:hypothetical protein